MRPCEDSAEGFTLIEALAGVAVTAAVLAGLGAISGQWLPHWRHGFVSLQNADLIGLALDRVVADVSAAEYARLDSGQGAPLFQGGPDAVMFVRQEIGPDAAPRLEIVRIGETAAQTGDEVERARARFVPGGVGALRDATTLLRPPFRLAFAYAGPDRQWRAVWRGEAKLPRAVRLTVLGASGEVAASTAFALKATDAPQIAAQPLAADTDGAANGVK